MTLGEAKELLADYLVGNWGVSSEDAEQAWRVVEAEDEEHAERLRTMWGLDAEAVPLCDAFIESLDEFVSLPAATREKRMPALCAHVKECLHCRRAFWDVSALWAERAAEEGPVRVLCQGLRLQPWINGLLRAWGAGPVPEVVEAAASAMGGPSGVAEPLSVAGVSMRWELRDEEADCVVTFEVRAGLGPEIVLRVAVGRPCFEPTEDLPASVVLRSEESGRVCLRKTLTGRTEHERELRIPAGDWLLEIWTEGDVAHRWVIPVNVDPDAAEA